MISLLILSFLFACVPPSTAVEYAERAHPECEDHHSLSHNYGGGEANGGSQTEVQMTCEDDVKRSITVKCIWGMGIISDTTCHENN